MERVVEEGADVQVEASPKYRTAHRPPTLPDGAARQTGGPWPGVLRRVLLKLPCAACSLFRVQPLHGLAQNLNSPRQIMFEPLRLSHYTNILLLFANRA